MGWNFRWSVFHVQTSKIISNTNSFPLNTKISWITIRYLLSAQMSTEREKSDIYRQRLCYCSQCYSFHCTHIYLYTLLSLWLKGSAEEFSSWGPSRDVREWEDDLNCKCPMMVCTCNFQITTERAIFIFSPFFFFEKGYFSVFPATWRHFYG